MNGGEGRGGTGKVRNERKKKKRRGEKIPALDYIANGQVVARCPLEECTITLTLPGHSLSPTLLMLSHSPVEMTSRLELEPSFPLLLSRLGKSSERKRTPTKEKADFRGREQIRTQQLLPLFLLLLPLVQVLVQAQTITTTNQPVLLSRTF
ncbi:hypothetical protein F5H01DRAFT_15371 [Linnemannia elongata]|nr:hypothetical protein F5H01DRAFT_15371 [Linnemannia elongata]